MVAAVKEEEPSDGPFETGPNPRLFPRINQLARISFFIAIGAILGGLYILFAGHSIMELFIIVLFLTSVFGVFCGHCACKQISARRPHQKGKAMAVVGLIGCYGCMVWCFLVVWLLGQSV